MGWRDAMDVEPAWYVDLLLDGLRSEPTYDGDVVAELEPPPDTLESWR
jgi:hypothetical protein